MSIPVNADNLALHRNPENIGRYTEFYISLTLNDLRALLKPVSYTYSMRQKDITFR
jgi:hypothetical protein